MIGCSSSDPILDDSVMPPLPELPGVGVKDPKPKGMWIGGEVNFSILSVKESTDKYLKQLKATGINFIYLGATGPSGYALCEIDAIPPYVEMTYDIFDYVLTRCDELEIDVIANMIPLYAGDQRKKKGIYYESDRWTDKIQYRKYNPDKGADYQIIPITQQQDADCIMLDPCLREVREYTADLCAQVVRKYMHHKSFRGVSLDYYRYSNAATRYNADGSLEDLGWYGYGPNILKEFTSMMGITPNNENDFINQYGGPGELFAEWLYFRSMCVAEGIRLVSKRCKEVYPECEMHLWASAHWDSRYQVGQNWATTDYIPTGSHYLKGYEKTGFADAIDVFSLGAYAANVYIAEDPSTPWSVENFVTTYHKYIPKNHHCKVWASVQSYDKAYVQDPTKLRDAVLLCLQHTDGMSVFELCHVKNNNQWSTIKQGIDLSGY